MNAEDLAALRLDPDRVAAAGLTEWAHSRWLRHRGSPRRAAESAIRAVALLGLVHPDVARRAARAVAARDDALASPGYPLLVAVASAAGGPSDEDTRTAGLAAAAWFPEHADDAATAALFAALVVRWGLAGDRTWLDVGQGPRAPIDDDLVVVVELVRTARRAGPRTVGRLGLPLELWIDGVAGGDVHRLLDAALRATEEAWRDEYHWRRLLLTIAPVELELALLLRAAGPGIPDRPGPLHAVVRAGSAILDGDGETAEVRRDDLPSWWGGGPVPW